MSSQALRATEPTVSIGTVVDILSADFSDISLSKVRFLESTGLITPARTESGYRRYTNDDIQRLRYILTAQRDYFLPNKVIGEQLQRVDNGEITLRDLMQQGGSPLSVVTDSHEDFSHVSKVRLTERSLCIRAHVEPEFLDVLLDADLVRPTGAGFYVEDDLVIVEACKILQDAGIDARHLRSFRTSISHMAELIRQATGVTRTLQTAETKGNVVESARELANAMSDLSAGLLKQRLRDVLEF